ncbi:MAG TPA: RNA methyltransferase [Bacteroidetes bacterium]|nr:RNA methyltransferase [Bacteroidota bacterium]HRK04406.1 TrmH family RNA methyltransferase [Chlorobiota bacterium]
MQKLTHAELLEKRLSEEELSTSKRFPVRVILDDVRSLYNVGSIFRTCDAYRVEHLYLCGFTPAPPRAEIAKTALGADRTVPWTAIAKIEDAISVCREAGHQIYTLEIAHGSLSIHDVSSQNMPITIILGNELVGVREQAIHLSDGILEIPMYGTKHSLNVAVSAGIVLDAVVSAYLRSR